MTQAANLAALGSNVNSSGQTSLTAGVNGVLPLANGGTNNTGGPTFWAWQNASSQTITGGASSVKIVFDSTLWNTNGYNTSTSTFTPNVAGYYQVVASVGYLGSNMSNTNLYLFKNGSGFTDLRWYTPTGTNPIFFGTFLVYLNGTTDNISIYVDAILSSGTTISTVNTGSSSPSDRTYFGAVLVRSA